MAEKQRLEMISKAEPFETSPPPYSSGEGGYASSSESAELAASSSTRLLYPIEASRVAPQAQFQVFPAPPTTFVATQPQVSPAAPTVVFVSAQPPKKCNAFVDEMFDLDAWMAAIYFVFIGFPISIFGFCWCITTIVSGVFAWICPPVGLLIWTSFSYSWRMLGRLELVTLEMCGKPFLRNDSRRQNYVRPIYHPVFKVLHPRGSDYQHGILSQIWELNTDRYTIASALYFIGFDFLYSTFAFCVMVPLFCLMACCIPVGCIVAKKMAIFKIRVAHHMLASQ